MIEVCHERRTSTAGLPPPPPLPPAAPPPFDRDGWLEHRCKAIMAFTKKYMWDKQTQDRLNELAWLEGLMMPDETLMSNRTFRKLHILLPLKHDYKDVPSAKSGKPVRRPAERVADELRAPGVFDRRCQEILDGKEYLHKVRGGFFVRPEVDLGGDDGAA